ncbi:hypothetical protein [Leptospira levettii]|uniref:DUF3592 domain-containing protein n=1 Tax=Leptospira levettii TaxID=2023178 RepID=A0AAW5VB59_9LEPT|nr:hypothetical protein [Leptospira levettii]MCW7466936.1 hypothetical protein [Leptospira levettii]MCW7497404.1 hypothetical protein [Leptospira levettii]MCW7512658.1 hypothetical protein [Leptospira levettii]MCW7516092.1 hypothetical protein [Leptospira levettii]TGL73740.1 hypothetical protein EHQ60_03690 [Leptospira levettii]
MAILIPLVFLFSYFFIRKIWFQLRKIRTVGTIERIELGYIRPNLILPEVKVHYKYYFQSGLYYGSGYLGLSDFLPTEGFHLHLGPGENPILYVGDLEIITEEHIEHYLLSKGGSVFLYLDPIEPYHSRIDTVNLNSITVPSDLL